MKVLSVLTLVTAVFAIADGVNVLYLSNVPSPSHFIWCKALLSSLHERGHNITAVSPDVEASTHNFTYYHLEKVYESFYNGTAEINFFEIGQKSFIEAYLEFSVWSDDACAGCLSSKGYQQLLDFPDDFKFDLIVYDFTMSQCLLALVHKFNYPPMLSVTPFLFTGKFAQLSGSLTFPAFLPSPDSALSQRLTFFERVVTTLQNVFEIVFDKYYITGKSNKRVSELHPGLPHIDDIEKKATKMIMVNTQPISDYKQPVFSNVKLVGGIQIKKPKILPVELKETVDRSAKGVVLFSLGTNVRSDTLGDEKILKIIRAFERLDNYTFLWKFETKEKLPIKLPKNVLIQSWMPQNDVLAHPNTKLFISHCGLLSTQEALWYGVPVLGFPVFGDQHQNSFRLKKLGVGETLSIIDFTEDELFATIKKLLEDPKYQTKIKSISSALRDQPMTPIEEATYWAEWLLRHSDVDISSPSIDLNLFARHSLDVFLFLLIIILTTLASFAKLIHLLIRMFSKDKKNSIEKKKN